MQPDQAEDWIEVARERAADAEALVESRADSVACVYLAGYAIECSLKAYLQRKGAKVPTGGPKGHDLKQLWAATGFKHRDLADPDGSRSYFLQSWSTSLRYEKVLEEDAWTSDELVRGARSLSAWLQTRAKRRKRRRR